MKKISILMLMLLLCTNAYAEEWVATAYCSCKQCCNKSDGITASGTHAHVGTVACNWLPFGTRLRIKGMGVYVVEDRGAKSQFGSKNNHKHRLDIWMPTHKQALVFGRRNVQVEVL